MQGGGSSPLAAEAAPASTAEPGPSPGQSDPAQTGVLCSALSSLS